MQQTESRARKRILELVGPLSLEPDRAMAAAESVQRSLARYQLSMTEPRAGCEIVYIEARETAKGIEFLKTPIAVEVKSDDLRAELLGLLESLETCYEPALFNDLSEATQRRFESAISILTDEMIPELLIKHQSNSHGGRHLDARQKRLIRSLASTWQHFGGRVRGGTESGEGPFLRYLRGAVELVGINAPPETVRSWMRFQLGSI